MSYIKTIYNNARQINMANMNKIEDKLEELDSDMLIVKGKLLIQDDEIASSDNITYIQNNFEKITEVKCSSEKVENGTKLIFTFLTSEDNNLVCDVVIPNASGENK